jgi:hypothetical protein
MPVLFPVAYSKKLFSVRWVSRAKQRGKLVDVLMRWVSMSGWCLLRIGPFFVDFLSGRGY